MGSFTRTQEVQPAAPAAPAAPVPTIFEQFVTVYTSTVNTGSAALVSALTNSKFATLLSNNVGGTLTPAEQAKIAVLNTAPSTADVAAVLRKLGDLPVDVTIKGTEYFLTVDATAVQGFRIGDNDLPESASLLADITANCSILAAPVSPATTSTCASGEIEISTLWDTMGGLSSPVYDVDQTFCCPTV